MENQFDSEAFIDDKRLLQIARSLASGYPMAIHLVTAPDQSRDFPLLPISDHHTVVIVDPVVDIKNYWDRGILKSRPPSSMPSKYIITYREIDQTNYDEYSNYAQGAEEKDTLADVVEKHEASSVEELINVLSLYDLEMQRLQVARMTD